MTPRGVARMVLCAALVSHACASAYDDEEPGPLDPDDEPACTSADCDGDPANGCSPPDEAGSCGTAFGAVILVDARLYAEIGDLLDEYRRLAADRRGFGIALQVVEELDDMGYETVRQRLLEYRTVTYPALEGVLLVGNVALPTFYKPRNDLAQVGLIPRYYEDLDAQWDKLYEDGAVDPACSPETEPSCAVAGPIEVPRHDFDFVAKGPDPDPEIWAAYMPVGFAADNSYERYGAQLRPYLEKLLSFYRGEILDNGHLYFVSNDRGEDFPSTWRSWPRDRIDFYGRPGPDGETGAACLTSSANLCYQRWPLEEFASVEEFEAAHAAQSVGEGWQDPEIFVSHMGEGPFQAVEINAPGLVGGAQARDLPQGGIVVALSNSRVGYFAQPDPHAPADPGPPVDENLMASFLYGSSETLAVLGSPFSRAMYANYPTVWAELRLRGNYLGSAHRERMKVNYARAGEDPLVFRAAGMELLMGDPFLDLRP